ncbi:DNA polymerase III subunit alpha [Candidatus Uhrbacteria bacterium]|nr:DNA polymerase III subunit alpha [Candidatus Uhrbacteria bacterium]
MPSPFIHLHVHSHYSLLQALPQIDPLVKRAKEMGMESLALTDYGAMYGIIEFYEACTKAGIKPILGLEAYMAFEKLTDKRPRIDDRTTRLVLLAETLEGYKNLMQLSTAAHLEGFYYKPRIDKDLLREHAKGLIGLSGGAHGEIDKALAMDEFGKAEALAREYEGIFGTGNFFLEVQDRPEQEEQQAHNRELLKLSERTGIPLVATKDVHYLDHDDAEAHDVLLCIGNGRTVNEENRFSMLGADYSFVSAEHMVEAFKDFPGAVENTVKIAERCNVKLELGKWNFADIGIPEGKNYNTHLRDLAYEGMAAKAPEITDEIKTRLEYELDIICKKGYAPYFLVVSDYVQWARAQAIISTTRGSAAGSLVSYAIGITTVNPLAYKLPFERFLNPFRPSPPDVDMDFADERRDEVIAYVTDKYGKDKVAQICTFGTMAARAAVRDVGRGLGLPYGFVDRVAKMIPMGSQGFPMTVERALEENAELKKLADDDAQVKRLIDLAQRVEGCARHVSVHAAGVVIAPRPLTDFTPLQREPGGDKIITQYEMHAVEQAGVLKSDFLGIRNLSILGLAVKIIKQTKGVDIDIQNLPLDDELTYKRLADGDTIGLFQLGGSGMTRYLKELKPSNIFDIMAMVALFRPGPMDSIPDFIRRKHNPKLITYLDPRLKEILSMSYGIITYQDDVLLTAINLAGYNWEEADKLRKAMGKKIPAEMAAQKEKFLSGCVKNGLTKDKSNELWKLIEPFAAYGFNKCLTGDTKIMDPADGSYRTLREMFEDGRSGQVVALQSDRKVRAEKRFQAISNGKKPVFELVTRSGRRIRATANHPFMTMNGWTRLDDLQQGARIALARRLPCGPGAGGDERRWRTLGYLIAEGNLCHPHGIYFYSTRDEEIQDFIASLEPFENCKTTIDRSKSAASVYVGKRDPRQRNGLRSWLDELGVMGKRATEKFLPAAAYTLNSSELSQLLGGMWQGDGCIHPSAGGQIFYATSSAGLAEQVQHLLLRLGVFSTLHAKRFSYRGGIRPGFTVHVSHYENIRRFAETVGEGLLENKKAVLRSMVRRLDATYAGTGGIIARGTKDIVPVVVLEAIREQMAHNGVGIAAFARDIGVSPRLFHDDYRRIGFSRAVVDRIADGLDSPDLKALATSDMYWDEIVAITAKGEEMTYDLEVPGSHNFVANDIIVHNSHAASYAIVAYQTAYLKANYPVEFMTAVLTAESGNTDTIAEAVTECAKMGITVLPPDVNSSGASFTYIDDKTIRFGLIAVKNLGSDMIDAVIAERVARGPFIGVTDFSTRIANKSFNKKSLEALIMSGAMDCLGERNQLLASVDQILSFHKNAMRDVDSGQKTLFSSAPRMAAAAEIVLRPVPAATKREKLAWERELLGLYVSAHPFKEYADYFSGLLTQIASLDAAKHKSGLVLVGGIIMEAKQITTKKNDLMAFIRLEDTSGGIEAVVFPSIFKTSAAVWVKDAPVLIYGKFEEREGEKKILCEKVRPLTNENLETSRNELTFALRAGGAPAAAVSPMTVEEATVCVAVPPTMPNSFAEELKRVFTAHPGGRRVFLVVRGKGASKKIATSFSIALGSDSIADIERLVGKGAVLHE